MSEPRSLIFIPNTLTGCVNKRTLDDVEEIENASPLVAFGSPEAFVCYTLDDLKTSLRALDGVHDYRLLKYDKEAGHAMSLEKEVVTLTLRQVEELREVIADLKDDELTALFTQIDVESEGLREKIREINRVYSQLSEDDKINFKKALRAMFRAGMFARRWRGDGHPYPKLEEETMRTDNFDIDADTLTELGNVSSFSDLLSVKGSELFSNLPVITHQKTPRPIDITIQELLSRIMNGSCARANTLLLIGTGVSYLRYLCRETIEGYDAQGYEYIAVSPEERDSSIFGAAAGMQEMNRGPFVRHNPYPFLRYQHLALPTLIICIIFSILLPATRSILSLFMLVSGYLLGPTVFNAIIVMVAGMIASSSSPIIGLLLVVHGIGLVQRARPTSRDIAISVIGVSVILALAMYLYRK